MTKMQNARVSVRVVIGRKTN